MEVSNFWTQEMKQKDGSFQSSGFEPGNPDRQDEQSKPRKRSKTIAYKKLASQEIVEGLEVANELENERPESRSDCVDGQRPCPWVSCKFHLYLDVNPITGSIKLNFPDKEVWELEDSCVLDVAERGPVTLEEVGTIMNLTRERIRQLEASGTKKIKATRLALEFQRFTLGKKKK